MSLRMHLLHALACLLIALIGLLIHDLTGFLSQPEHPREGDERTIFLEGQSTLAEGDAEVQIENTYNWKPGKVDLCEHPRRRLALLVTARGHEGVYLIDASASTEDLFRAAAQKAGAP